MATLQEYSPYVNQHLRVIYSLSTPLKEADERTKRIFVTNIEQLISPLCFESYELRVFAQYP